MMNAIDLNTTGDEIDPLDTTEITIKTEPSIETTELQTQSDAYAEMGHQIYFKTELVEPKISECLTVKEEISFDSFNIKNEFKDLSNSKEENIKNSVLGSNLQVVLEKELPESQEFIQVDKNTSKEHICTHVGDKSQYTNKCEKRCGRESHLEEENELEKHKDESYSNKLVNQSPSQDEKAFSCNVCGKTFSCNGVLTKHLRIHTGEKPFKCDICEKSFIEKYTLKEHMFTHTGDKSHLKHECDLCEKRFRQRTHLAKHKFTKHGDNSCLNNLVNQSQPGNQTGNPSQDEKAFNCDVCGKTFIRKFLLTKHLRIHTGEKPFKCDICEKSFIEKHTLKEHMFTHTGDKSHLKHECDLCEKKFRQRTHLERHKFTKHGDNSCLNKLVKQTKETFSCDVCGRVFDHKPNLIRHFLVHTGEKHFKCDTCGKSFTQKGTLKEHIFTHTRDKSHYKYGCNLCGKRYRQSSKLDRHKLSKHGDTS